jgi:uncharacterized membrane protein
MQVTTAPLFAAELTPHRTVSPRGVRVVIGLVVLMGILPVLAVAGLHPGFVAFGMVAILASITWILWARSEHGRRREVVSLWSDRLEITRFGLRGEETAFRFDPLTVRLLVERDINERTTGLKLRGPDQVVPVGDFLSTEEKSSFAKALGSALRKARA